jgi:hypothetical protein
LKKIMAQNDGVYVFDSGAASKAVGGIDPNLLLALNQNGGMGGGYGFYWIFLLWMMWSQNGRNGNFNDYVASVNGNEGRQYLAEIMNGRFDNLGQLAQIINTGVETVKSGIFALQNNISQVGANVGLTAAQTQNAIAMGDAALAKQLCECCCNMRYDLAQQTNTLQAQAASNFANQQLQSAQNHAATQLQMAQIESADQLAVCRQTNELATQADRNSNAILNAINAQTVAMNDQFCALKERELQTKIDTQGDIITQLRGQISNDKQTEAFTSAFNALNEKINILSAKSPNTVPVVYPNLTAVNNTPYGGGFNPWGYGFGGQSYWG